MTSDRGDFCESYQLYPGEHCSFSRFGSSPLALQVPFPGFGVVSPPPTHTHTHGYIWGTDTDGCHHRRARIDTPADGTCAAGSRRNIVLSQAGQYVKRAPHRGGLEDLYDWLAADRLLPVRTSCSRRHSRSWHSDEMIVHVNNVLFKLSCVPTAR